MENSAQNEQLVHEICRRVGYFGNLLSMSKSGYREANPNNLVVFNANLVTADGSKIWYGDIDITRSGDALKSMANTFDVGIYVLSEMDGRFENEAAPKIDRYVIKFNPDGTHELAEYLKDRGDNYTLNF